MSLENFRQCITKKKPTVFHDINLEKKLSLYTPDFFKEKFGDVFVEIKTLQIDNNPYTMTDKDVSSKKKLRDFINLLPDNNSLYMAGQDLKIFNGLSFEKFFDLLLEGKKLIGRKYLKIWIGSNTKSGIHYDMFDNIFIQVYGKKTLALTPPEDIKYLYPIRSDFPKSSITDPFEVDIKRYPRFAKTNLRKIILKPGDIVFIPRGWFHYFQAPDTSISVNCFFGKSLETHKFLMSFYRAGPNVWLTTVYQFFAYGILGVRYKKKLFSPPPWGKLLFDYIRQNLIAFLKSFYIR